MATGALPRVKEGGTDSGKSASCPFSFPGGALCQIPVMLIWALQIFGMRSSGKLDPFDTIFLCPRPFVLAENDRCPSCFLRGWNSCCEVGCQVQASVWLCMSFPRCQDGSRLVQVGSPSKAQLQNCKGKERTKENLSVVETFSYMYLYTRIYTHNSSLQNQQFFLFSSFQLTTNQTSSKGSVFSKGQRWVTFRNEISPQS